MSSAEHNQQNALPPFCSHCGMQRPSLNNIQNITPGAVVHITSKKKHPVTGKRCHSRQRPWSARATTADMPPAAGLATAGEEGGWDPCAGGTTGTGSVDDCACDGATPLGGRSVSGASCFACWATVWTMVPETSTDLCWMIRCATELLTSGV